MKADMVCGGIYTWADAGGRKFQGTLVSITHSPNGVIEGTMLATGFAPELVRPNTERWEQFTLVGRPSSAKLGRPSAPKVGRPKKKA
jgi:hypothetical protein